MKPGHCRTCNAPLTTKAEVERGACLPHGIDNRLEIEDEAAELDEAARGGVWQRPADPPRPEDA